MGSTSDGAFNINLTDEPDEVVSGWAEQLENAADEHYILQKYRTKSPTARKLIRFFLLGTMAYKQGRLTKAVANKARSLVYAILGIKRKTYIGVKKAHYRKAKDISVTDFSKGVDHSTCNKEATLRNINRKLCELK